jgi:hypothetical protein
MFVLCPAVACYSDYVLPYALQCLYCFVPWRVLMLVLCRAVLQCLCYVLPWRVALFVLCRALKC